MKPSLHRCVCVCVCVCVWCVCVCVWFSVSWQHSGEEIPGINQVSCTGSHYPLRGNNCFFLSITHSSFPSSLRTLSISLSCHWLKRSCSLALSVCQRCRTHLEQRNCTVIICQAHLVPPWYLNPLLFSMTFVLWSQSCHLLLSNAHKHACVCFVAYMQINDSNQ